MALPSCASMCAPGCTERIYAIAFFLLKGLGERAEL